MKIFAPSYYGSFHCISSRCRNNCCVGWEIDVDEQTYEKYMGFSQTDSAFGIKLREGIAAGPDGYHFILTADERCPFLDKEGLCTIYSRMGADALCQICADHPRFRNFFTGRTEVGLGLCCEAAAELIMYGEGMPEICLISDDNDPDGSAGDDEAELIACRDRALEIISAVSDIDAAQKELSAFYRIPAVSFEPAAAAELMSSLEIMDGRWKEQLDILAGCGGDMPCHDCGVDEIVFRRLLWYFIFRHASDTADMCDFRVRCAFAVLCTDIIRALCAARKRNVGECTREYAADIARLFSAEIEYSEENTDAMLDYCENLIIGDI